MVQAQGKTRIGLVVNPYAGLGGRVGLKGSDGTAVVEKALALGAVPEAPPRAQAALAELSDLASQFDLLTYAGHMGEEEAMACGLKPILVGEAQREISTAADTEEAVRKLEAAGIDILLFAGGDGTARNVLNALQGDIPVIGIPAGVKMHSPVYANNPASAGKLAALFVLGQASDVRDVEVMDIDEEAFRDGRVSAKLYGYLTVPYVPLMLQGLKKSAGSSEATALMGIAQDIVEGMAPGVLYVIGPGTTTRPIAELLGLTKTLLGVDLVRDKELVARDVNEQELLKVVPSSPTKIIVTPIGGQGFIFGRGNQQISHRVLRYVKREDILVVATREKLASIEGRPLLVDTGNRDMDLRLAGFQRILTGYRQEVIYKVSY